MPTLPMLHTYQAGPINQIVLPNEIVGIWVNKVYEFYKVQYIEPITRSSPVTIDLGALAAAAASDITQVTLLQMPDLEFAQLRMEVLDDVEVVVSQGRADMRHKMQAVVSTLSRMNPLWDICGHQTELYEFEDNYIFLQATNQTSYALAQARIAFWGYRYVLESQPQFKWANPQVLPERWTRIPATAHL